MALMEHKSKDLTFCETFGVTSQHSEKLHINNFPYGTLKRILKNFSFAEIARLRSVSKLFNEICGDLLNSEFYRLRNVVQVRYAYIKSRMPRRESSRRTHILSRENDIVETLHMRLALMNITVGKHVERNHCCFFAGEVLDEVNRLLNYVKRTLHLNRSFKVTDELFDLSTMAVDYFKEHIEPALPEVIYFTDSIGNPLTSPPKPSTSTATVPETQSNPTPSLSELHDSLESVGKIVYRNQMSIKYIKSSMKSLLKNIDKLETTVQKIQKQQDDSEEMTISKSCSDKLLSGLNQCSMTIDLIKSHLPKCQRINKLSCNTQIESLNSETVQPSTSTYEPLNSLQIDYDNIPDSYENSNSSKCISTSENADNNEFHSPSYESVASTSTAYYKRKAIKNISKSIPKKRKK